MKVRSFDCIFLRNIYLEHSLLESNEEQNLASDIERDLTELYECIQSMRQSNSSPLSNNQEAWIRRYYEIHFDYSTEFKNTSATVQRKRESIELMQSSKFAKSADKDSSVTKLLKEKLSIANSMRDINEVISQAFEAKNTLNHQKAVLGNSGTGLNALTSNVPGIGKLIEGIQKKKYKESLTIALVIALILCFIVW